MSSIDYFSCKDMLFLPSMKDSRIIAGKGGMNLPITKVNTLEMPDIIDWLTGGEFLITTAFAFKGDINRLVKNIALFKKKNVRGIAIKPKRFIEITDELCEACDLYDFPLITLPHDAIFADIVKESIEAILERETSSFSRAQNIVESLISGISQNKSLSEVVRSLQNEINRKIIVISNNEVVCGDDIVTNSPEFLQKNISLIQKGGVQSLNINGAQTTAYIYSCGSANSSFIAALESNNPFSEGDKDLLRRIGAVIDIEIKNLQSLNNMKNKYQDWFLRAWLTGELKDEHDILLCAESYGLSLDKNKQYFVAIADFMQPQSVEIADKIKVELLRRITSSGKGNIFITFLQKITIVVTLSGDKNADELSIRTIRDTIMHYLQNDVSFYIGAPCSVDKVSTAYSEALEISRVAVLCGIKNDYLTYDSLGIYSVLSLLPDNDIVKNFKTKFLGELKAYDKEHDTKLIETLKYYYQYNCNAKLTAQKIFAHYNTVLYRIDRIKNILGLDIDEADIRLQLQVALKLDEISK